MSTTIPSSGGGKIVLLPDQVSKQIRSGFTINSLATCVKELLENSLDAKPTRVDITLERQGYDSITVRDDGTGIKYEDLLFVAKRFYTSKYESMFVLSSSHHEDQPSTSDDQDSGEDLSCSLGFRGEAMHSLCTNCEEVHLITKTENDDLGTKVVFDSDGNIINEQKISCVRGTTVVVRNIFGRGLPVRRKRLLDDLQKEFNAMMDVIHEYCLSPMNCSTIITVKNKQDPSPLYVKQKHSNMGEAICNVFSRQLLPQMVMLTSDSLPEDNLLAKRVAFKIALHVPKMNNGDLLPNTPKKTKLFIFLNGRPIDHFGIKVALKNFYREISSILFLGICCIEYESVESLNEHVDIFLAPNKREVRFTQETQIIRIIRDILELLKPVKSTQVSPETVSIIQEDRARQANCSTSTAMDVLLASSSTQRAPLATQIELLLNSKTSVEQTAPASRSPIVAKIVPASREISPNKGSIPVLRNSEGVLERMEPIQFQHHYRKSSSSKADFEDRAEIEDNNLTPSRSPPLNLTNKRVSPPANDANPVHSTTQDATFFAASKYNPHPRKSMEIDDEDSEEDEVPTNRSIIEFFGSDSQKQKARSVSLSAATKTTQKRKRKQESEIQILDLSSGAKKQRLITSNEQESDTAVVVAKLNTDDVCTKFMDLKMRNTLPPMSTKFFKCFEDKNWTIRRSDLSRVSVLGPSPYETPLDLAFAPILLKMNKRASSGSKKSDRYRTADCTILIMSVFESDRLVQLNTLKYNANYETNIVPLDNPVNLLAIPKFKQNQKILHALVAPCFDAILKQNGFHIEVVKQTRKSMSQQQNSQTQKTQTVLTALKLKGIAKPNHLEQIESSITGPYGEEDLLDLAARLVRFKDELLPRIVEKLVNYRRLPGFDPENPIAHKSMDQLREYVCKKAIGALRPKRLTMLLELQAAKMAETHCQDCLVPSQDTAEEYVRQYDFSLLSKLAEDVIQKLSGPLLTSPLARMVDSVASSANAPIDEKERETNEQKIGSDLSKLFVPVCTF